MPKIELTKQNLSHLVVTSSVTCLRKWNGGCGVISTWGTIKKLILHAFLPIPFIRSIRMSLVVTFPGSYFSSRSTEKWTHRKLLYSVPLGQLLLVCTTSFWVWTLGTLVHLGVMIGGQQTKEINCKTTVMDALTVSHQLCSMNENAKRKWATRYYLETVLHTFAAFKTKRGRIPKATCCCGICSVCPIFHA